MVSDPVRPVMLSALPVPVRLSEEVVPVIDAIYNFQSCDAWVQGARFPAKGNLPNFPRQATYLNQNRQFPEKPPYSADPHPP
jgi:hypothetical protein